MWQLERKEASQSYFVEEIMKRYKKLFISILLISIIGVGVCVLWINHLSKIKADLKRLEEESYDTVFFSMYSIDNYEEDDWMHFRAMDIVKTAYEIPSSQLLQKYLETAKVSGNTITTVYLGIDPKRAKADRLAEMIQQNPGIMFEVILSYPKIDYWMEMGEKRSNDLLQEYQKLAESVVSSTNAHIYLFGGEEWLICNSSNYEDTFCTNAEVSRFLMCNADYQHSYILKADNLQERFGTMKVLLDNYRNNPIEYASAEHMDIVFLGDSVIGNYTNSLSVPEVVSALSGARVYNCGYGGKGAALSETTQVPLPTVVEAIIKEDVTNLPQQEQVSMGVKAFSERTQKDRRLMFVINHGLNDYFCGVPVASQDAYDVSSYSGALRVAIENLQKTYPHAQILLITPNFTSYFENGLEKKSEPGGSLEDYAEAAIRLAEEMNIDLLDNFHELPIEPDNWIVYLEDGCHPNERGRFLIGSRIAQKIRTE